MGSELHVQVRNEVHGLLNHFMADRWHEVAAGIATVTDTGVCYTYNDEMVFKAGFGAIVGLQPSIEVLEKLTEINRFNKLAHAWLIPEDDGAAWSVMVSFKLAYLWTAAEELRQFMYTILTNQQMVLEIVHGMLLPLGGRPYWDPQGGMEQVHGNGFKLADDLGG